MSQNDCTSGGAKTPRRWLTVKETAEALEISESSVYEAIKRGELKAMVRRGYSRGYRIEATEVERWISEEWVAV